MSRIKLCVNIDHVATVREARGGIEPDLYEAARICEENGCDGITIHLREDRRHIQDQDVIALRDIVMGKFNLEMALAEDVIEVALKANPNMITLVPEKREELTTEGGLDVKSNKEEIKKVVKRFKDNGAEVSLFVEPDFETIQLAKDIGADFIEIHTGEYCNAVKSSDIDFQLNRILDSAKFAKKIGIRVNAGHGLNYLNTAPVLACEGLEELNIGHSIISRSIFVGLPQAVSEMVTILKSRGK